MIRKRNQKIQSSRHNLHAMGFQRNSKVTMVHSKTLKNMQSLAKSMSLSIRPALFDIRNQMEKQRMQ